MEPKQYNQITLSKGFTIVELLIVIVVIGILAAIVIVAFNGVQSRARDTERKSEIATFVKKLGVFHATNSYYPNAYQMRDASYRLATFGLNDTASRPTGGSTMGYCWATSPAQYCYVPAITTPGSGDCTGAADITQQCGSYAITYALESNPSTQIRINSP